MILGEMKVLTGNPGPRVWQAPPELHKPPTTEAARSCSPLCVYNLTADPEERHDLAPELPPAQVAALLGGLERYSREAFPAYNDYYYFSRRCDSAANPEHHGGVWTPWKAPEAVLTV